MIQSWNSSWSYDKGLVNIELRMMEKGAHFPSFRKYGTRMKEKVYKIQEWDNFKLNLSSSTHFTNILFILIQI